MTDDQQVPSTMQVVADITDQMLVAAILGRQQIARPRITSFGCKGASDNAGEFAGNEDAHHFAPSVLA
jgi:hypothetical protein